MAFCTDLMESPGLDHHLKKALKPLSTLKPIDNKEITNPYLFRDAPMVTTFVRSASNRTKELWCFIEEASRTDIRLAGMEHPPSMSYQINVRAGSRFMFIPVSIGP